MILLKAEEYRPAEEDELLRSEDEILVYFHPSNNSLHIVDCDTMLKIEPSYMCKSRNHAIQILESHSCS